MVNNCISKQNYWFIDENHLSKTTKTITAMKAVIHHNSLALLFYLRRQAKYSTRENQLLLNHVFMVVERSCLKEY